MKINPVVSVILPYYNAEHTIAPAIESILGQSVTSFELLLINNNSTDNSLHIAQEFAKTDQRIVLLDEKKQGVANAMNCGLKNAKGRFIARMDADDISMKNRFEKQLHFLTENPCTDLVGCNVKYIPHGKNTAGFSRFVKWANSVTTTEEIELNRFIEIPVINPTIFFRREIYKKLGGTRNGNFPEDYEMLLRYLDAGVKMAKLNEQLLEWHDSPTRLTRTDERYSTEAFFRIKAHYFKKWSENNNAFHPAIYIWGAGRKTRQRATFLKNEGLNIRGYIDIDKQKTIRKDTIHYTEIPGPGKLFIVSMVTNYGARDKIKKFLAGLNYIEGVDFILMG